MEISPPSQTKTKSHFLFGIKILVYDLVYASLVLSVWMFFLSLCSPRDIVAYDVCFDMIQYEKSHERQLKIDPKITGFFEKPNMTKSVVLWYPYFFLPW